MDAVEAAWARVFAQKEQLPRAYGAFDFSVQPERFTTDLNVPSHMQPRVEAERPRLLANKERVELFRALTMTGDAPSDA